MTPPPGTRRRRRCPRTSAGSRSPPASTESPSSLGLTGTLTLDAQGDPNAVFVFQAGSTLITASASRVKLVNGAQPCNVFWQVGSSATLGTTTVFAGNIMALASITMNDGVTLHGRALARNGAVTLINDTITAAHCASGPARELDVSRALPAAAGIGANQGLRPNRAVEQALVAAGVDPTRSTWTRSTWTRVDLDALDVDAVDMDALDLDGRQAGSAAPWARATWTCATCASGDGGVEPTRASWTTASWPSHLDGDPSATLRQSMTIASGPGRSRCA